MEIGKRILETKQKELNIYFLGDMHLGNCNFDEKSLKESVEIVKNDPNGYWFGMGDYIEAITYLGDKRFDPITIAKNFKIRDLKDLPRKQMQEIYQMLEPIDEKCLALLVGNHEEAYIKYNTSDIYDIFQNMFKSKPQKLGYVGFYVLGIKNRKGTNKVNYTIKFSLNHGTGGGGYLEGYPTNLVHKVFKYTYADINVMGHIHKLVEDKKEITTVTSSGLLQRKPRLWGVSGCFLRTYVEGNTNYFEHRAGIGGESNVGMLVARLKLHSEGWSGKLEKIYSKTR